MPKRLSLTEKKQRRKRLIELLQQGHNLHSACILAGHPLTKIDRLKRFPLIKKAIERSKASINGEVTAALVKRAKGYEAQEKSQTVDKYGNIIDLQQVKHIPPDTKAASLWLENQDKENWKGTTTNNLLVNVSTEQLLLTLGGGGVGSLSSGRGGDQPTNNPTNNNNYNPNSNNNPTNNLLTQSVEVPIDRRSRYEDWVDHGKQYGRGDNWETKYDNEVREMDDREYAKMLMEEGIDADSED